MNDAPSLHERMEFDADNGELREGDLRYVMIRPDILMGMFPLMEAKVRPEALSALTWSAARHAVALARHYQALADENGQDMLELFESIAGELGWGVWQLRKAGESSYTLQVDNSPFARGHGPAEQPMCAPITGVLAALTGVASGVEMTAREIACTSMGAPRCRFRAVPAKGR